MKCQWLALALVVLALTAVMMGLVYVADLTGSAWAASSEQAPTLIEVDPSSAPNDLDSPIVITGTGFAATPTVTLGSTMLEEVGWVTSATLTATVPWGLDQTLGSIARPARRLLRYPGHRRLERR